MGARDSLLATLAVLKDCLNDPALIDQAPNMIPHNARARMLRQGLAVLVFSTVETFVRERTGEVLRSFTNRSLTFSDLSPALQKATTIGALEGIRFRLKLQPSNNKIAWLVGKLAAVSSATSNVRTLSDHSFGYSGSNIDEDDVGEILKSFGIVSPWSQITALTRRIGVAILDPETEFEAIKKRRHSSAHALSGHVLYSDLQASVRSALGICIAFDLLLSHSQKLFNRKIGPGLGGRPPISHADVELTFVQPSPTSSDFVIRNEQLPPPAPVLARSTVKTIANEAAAVVSGIKYAARKRRQLIVVDTSSIPSKWSTW